MQQVASLSELKLSQGKFWYLGSPYTKYEGGLEAAYMYAHDLSESLHQDHIPHYAPVVASHEWAQIAGIDPRDGYLWGAINLPWMDRAHGLIVVSMKGWKESVGLKAEMEWFKIQDRPVLCLDPNMIMPEEF